MSHLSMWLERSCWWCPGPPEGFCPAGSQSPLCWLAAARHLPRFRPQTTPAKWARWQPALTWRTFPGFNTSFIQLDEHPQAYLGTAPCLFPLLPWGTWPSWSCLLDLQGDESKVQWLTCRSGEHKVGEKEAHQHLSPWVAQWSLCLRENLIRKAAATGYCSGHQSKKNKIKIYKCSKMVCYAIWSSSFPNALRMLWLLHFKNTEHDETCWLIWEFIFSVSILLTGFITFVPWVLGSGEFRNSSVSLLQLPALLRSEWTINFS